MTSFERTETFRAILAPVDAEIASLQGRHDQLARTIESKKNANAGLSKSKQRPTLGDENRRSSIAKKLLDVQERKQRLQAGDLITHYQLVRIQAEMNEGIWTPEAAATLDEPRAQHEGRGEKAVHSMLGLPFEAKQTKRDLDDGDVKWMESAQHGLQTIQVGGDGREAYISFIMEECDAGLLKRKEIDPSVIAAFRRGEVTKELINSGLIPADVLQRLLSKLLPSRILCSYGNIYGAFSFGYVMVPADDADQAWSLVSVTKCMPRYALNKAYTHRMVVSAAQHRPNVAA